MTTNREVRPTVGARTVFNGVHAPAMFHVETIALPELAPGEILVKVTSRLSYVREEPYAVVSLEDSPRIDLYE